MKVERKSDLYLMESVIDQTDEDLSFCGFFCSECRDTHIIR